MQGTELAEEVGETVSSEGVDEVIFDEESEKETSENLSSSDREGGGSLKVRKAAIA